MRVAIIIGMSCQLFRRHRAHTIFWLAMLAMAAGEAGAQVRLPAGRGVLELEAKQQHKEGDVFLADGDVDIRYKNMRLRADHVEYNTRTDQASLNVRTGRGTFERVRGTIRIERHGNSAVLVSPNPLYFEAQEVERLDERRYKIRDAWVTVCVPDRPKWKFYAAHATLTLDRSVALVSANFRLFGVPLIYLPYATAPAGRKLRQSGFLIPAVATNSRKGLVLGDSYYWAPADWMDFTLGAQLLSRRGWSQHVSFRSRPWEDMHLTANYFGVVDRGLRGPNGVRVPEGGHQAQVEFDALLPQGWRAVANLNQLSSLTFRLAFADTFRDAVASEAGSAAFVTNNFRGFSLNFAMLTSRDFLSLPVATVPATDLVLRSAPGVRFSSVEQAPRRRWPIYFGFHVFADAVHRSESCNAGRPSCIGPGGTLLSQQRFETPTAVQRTEIAPQVTIP